MPQEIETALPQQNTSPVLNIGIIVGAVFLLGIGLFLYIKYDGAKARVSASETSQAGSNIKLGANLGDIKEGQIAPDFTLSDTSGKNYKLTDFKGKPTLIVFEATWCTYCHQQNDDVERLKKDVGDKMNVVSVDLREDVGTVLNAWQQRKNSRLVLVDSDGQVGTTYGVTSTPTNIFLNSDSSVYFKHPGLMGYDQMKQAFNQMI